MQNLINQVKRHFFVIIVQKKNIYFNTVDGNDTGIAMIVFVFVQNRYLHGNVIFVFYSCLFKMREENFINTSRGNKVGMLSAYKHGKM